MRKHVAKHADAAMENLLLAGAVNDGEDRFFTLAVFYTIWEAVFAVWRYAQYGEFKVLYRPDFADYMPAALTLCLIFLFLRSAIQSRENLASRRFAFIFVIPFLIVIINILRSFYFVSELVYHLFASIPYDYCNSNAPQHLHDRRG